jgi:beta-1,4-mannosyltransferase
MFKKDKKTVLVYPWTTNNPYQSLLKENLKVHGITTYSCISFFMLLDIFKLKPDIVHLHWLHSFYTGKTIITSHLRPLILWAQLIVMKSLNIRIVWTAHNVTDHENINPKLAHFCTNLVIKHASKIIVHCNKANELLAEEYSNFILEKSITIPHGNYIDVYSNDLNPKEARKILKLNDQDFIFLFIGSIRKNKGAIDLIKAFKTIRRENVKLLIAGMPSSESIRIELEEASKNEDNIISNFEFIPENDMQLYYNAANVLVLPYHQILTSGVALLGMSFGKPIIATRVGCLPEIIDDDNLLFTPSSVSELAKCLLYSLENRAETNHVAKKNQKYAEECNWSYVAQMTYGAYSSTFD